MKTCDVEYNVFDVKCKGYLVEPVTQGLKLPGVVMYTDFWGINSRQKKVAEKIANLGAVVFVADMYGEQKICHTFEESASLMNSVVKDENVYLQRTLAAVKQLKSSSIVKSEKIFSVGYCFGGATSLLLARKSDELYGAVSIHGLLSSKIRVGKDKKMPKLLILHGDRDTMVSDEDIKNFRYEMHACNADFTFVSFGLSTHAFTNTDAAGNEITAYNYLADSRSLTFLSDFINS